MIETINFSKADIYFSTWMMENSSCKICRRMGGLLDVAHPTLVLLVCMFCVMICMSYCFLIDHNKIN